MSLEGLILIGGSSNLTKIRVVAGGTPQRKLGQSPSHNISFREIRQPAKKYGTILSSSIRTCTKKARQTDEDLTYA